ncbi:MAG: hypothetical protein WC836_05065 [Desulfobacula sp.]
MQSKVEDDAFRKLYEKECHICSSTLKVIAAMEENGQLLSNILNRLDISVQAWNDLKEGEYCNPLIAKKLCSYLDLNDPDLFKNCSRL